MAISCVLLDLDGVVRHFDRQLQAEIERRHSLAPGSLMATGMSPDLIDRLVTGRLTRAQWIDELGRRTGSVAAATAMAADIGSPDPEMLALADDLRAGGIVVAIFTNGTDTIGEELATLGIDQHVDAVFNSAEIGLAKPDIAAFRHVCHRLRLNPESVYFTDDSPPNLSGAIELGMTADPFTGVEALRRRLQELRVL